MVAEGRTRTLRSGETERASALPEPTRWVHSIAVPVWISDPERRVCFVNRRAQDLLRCDPREPLDVPCYRWIAARDESGHSFCAERCPAFLQALRGDGVEPVTLGLADGERRVRWIHLLPLPVWSPEGAGPWMVHCATDVTRTHRLKDYLSRVASRSFVVGEGARPPTGAFLTPREREVLDHLSRDEDLPTVAARLHVSHVTVRNHVQRILPKLGVHSIAEAVARRLLDGTR